MISITRCRCNSRITAKLIIRYCSSTVDKSEIEHHNSFANKWWDKTNGPLKALHALNDLRIPFIRTGLINVNEITEEDTYKSGYLKGLKILDVGCGGGILSIPLAKLGGDVTGLDASSELIEVAKNYANKNLSSKYSVQFVDTSIEKHCLTHSNYYDALVLSEVIEHVTNKDVFLKACVDTLKPGGSLFVTTINRTTAAWFSVILMAEYVLNIVPKGNHEWSKLITLDEIKYYLKKADCGIVQINGMIYIPFRNVWLWFPNKSVNYAIHAVKRA